MPNRSPIDNGTFGLGDLDDAPAAINLGAFMRRDLEFIVQPQRLLRLTFSLNGGFWSIPSGRFADCRSCSLLARGAAWLADSNCGSLNSMTVTSSLMLLSLTRCLDGFVCAIHRIASLPLPLLWQIFGGNKLAHRKGLRSSDPAPIRENAAGRSEDVC